MACWNWLSRTSEIWWVSSAGPAVVDAARRGRLAALTAFARKHSAYYREAYCDVPARGVGIEDLPVVNKRGLMQRFDDWVTDPRVTRAGVDAFIADREQIGERFLGRYVLWKSSGTTGEPGIFVQDADALAVCDALITAQSDAAGLTQRFAQGMITTADAPPSLPPLASISRPSHRGAACASATRGFRRAACRCWSRCRGWSPS